MKEYEENDDILNMLISVGLKNLSRLEAYKKNGKLLLQDAGFNTARMNGELIVNANTDREFYFVVTDNPNRHLENQELDSICAAAPMPSNYNGTKQSRTKNSIMTNLLFW